MRTSIAFTDTIGAAVLENGKPRPFDRFANWTPASRPGGESAARQSDRALTVVRFRDEYRVHLELPGIPSWIGSNELLYARDFSNAAWTKTNCSASGGKADPYGGTEAQRLTATANDGNAVQVLANSTALVRTNSLWVRRVTGVGAVSLYDPTDSPAALALTNEWQRFSAVGASNIARSLRIGFATSGDAIDVYHAQMDYDVDYAGYPMLTTSAAVATTTMSEVADRLKYHLENGGVCTLNTGDISSTVHTNARMNPDSPPDLRLTDRELMEYTLSLDLLLTSRPVCRYFR